MSKQQSQCVVDKLCFEKELDIRRKKLSELRKQGEAFPNDFRRNITSDRLHFIYDEKQIEELELLNIEVSVAGRMVKRRVMGKASFITIKDMGGCIQLYVSSNNFLDNYYQKHFKKWDLGDILGARGIVFKTKTNELSIYCVEIRLLTKALRPLPDKFHGLVDQETCYRQRYLDLLSNEKTRQRFRMRSKIIAAIRQFMMNHEFIEVETPMMQCIPGGASARPFMTHHHTLDIDMYLRIAPELYLKRLVIGGFERIFEINRNFRNEGISLYHNPEFTMMELYMAYSDYKDIMELTEVLFRFIINNILGVSKIIYGEYVLNFNAQFEKLTMCEAIKKYVPDAKKIDLDNFDQIISLANLLNIQISKNCSIGHILTNIFEKTVEKKLIQPTFITDYPIEVSPLARRNDNNPQTTDRFELFMVGNEIANGFSELNDADEQAERFKKQLSMKHICDDQQVMFYDQDYVTALEYGLPPTAGLGVGIDRMVMLLTNSPNIRDVILFPTLRPDIKS